MSIEYITTALKYIRKLNAIIARLFHIISAKSSIPLLHLHLKKWYC